jgi:hypothetical protein
MPQTDIFHNLSPCSEQIHVTPPQIVVGPKIAWASAPDYERAAVARTMALPAGFIAAQRN